MRRADVLVGQRIAGNLVDLEKPVVVKYTPRIHENLLLNMLSEHTRK